MAFRARALRNTRVCSRVYSVRTKEIHTSEQSRSKVERVYSKGSAPALDQRVIRSHAAGYCRGWLLLLGACVAHK